MLILVSFDGSELISREANIIVVIVLAEYLTSDEAGQPLGNSFAWPLGRVFDISTGEIDNMEDFTSGHLIEHSTDTFMNGGTSNGKMS